jgi:hypothetical protein
MSLDIISPLNFLSNLSSTNNNKKNKMDINPEEDKKSSDNVGELSAITDLAETLKKKQALADSKEKELKEIKSEIHRIESDTLPSLMEEVGLSEVKLSDGSKVQVRPIIRASLPSASAIDKEKDSMKRSEMIERFRKGCEFLEEAGAGAIIKNILNADLGNDSEETAKEAITILEGMGIRAKADKNVNPNSLSSWIREMIEAGKEIDHDLFGVYTGHKAHIKPAR